MKNRKDMRIIDWIMKVPALDMKPAVARVKAIKRTTLVIILAVVALPGMLLSLGFVHLVGTQKLYCLNCHVNQKDTNFWQKSTAHPDINCATCHDEGEGGMLNSTFHFAFSADEDLVTAKCEGCHKDDIPRLVGLDAPVKTRPDNELVRIPHEMHINELGIKCTFCHYNVFHDSRPEGQATYRPRMDVCFTCHDSSRASCDSCHPAGLPVEFSLDGEPGGGNVRYYPEGFGPVTFNHKLHLEKGITCNNCHNKLFDLSSRKAPRMTMDGMFKGEGCGSCHNGKGAFSAMECGYCHYGSKSGGDLTYKMEGFGPVKFSHDNHLAMGLDCNGCHTKLFGFKKTSGKMTMDMINGGKYCGSCHDGKKAFSAETCDGCHSMG